MPDQVTRILVFCMGNICRSPTAEVVLRTIARRDAPELALEIDSAGTHDYHVGEPADPRAVAAARRRGYDLAPLRARQLDARDFERFDLLLAMDRRNVRDALAIAPVHGRERLRLLLDFVPDADTRDVPDPYYGGEAGFEHVLDLVEAAAQAIVAELRSRR
jgi:protein-tyrosine phosphatase